MKTVIEMAREAGCVFIDPPCGDCYTFDIDDGTLERFAELVRANERESICRLLEHEVDLAGISSAPQLQNYTTTLLKTLADCIRARGQA